MNKIEFGNKFKNHGISNLMRLNISIYASLDQQEPEIKINHPHNSGTIIIFLKNWRYYK